MTALPSLSSLSPETRRDLAAHLRAMIKRDESRRKLWTIFPDTGPLRRELYVKHLEFFKAGARHQERAIVGANRSGKTMAGGYEIALHLIGEYPAWWEGRRFNRPVTAWVSGEDAKAVRESLQVTLFGPPNDIGTGLIPGDSIIGKPTSRAGVPEAIDSANIRHSTGGTSRVTFKSYDQGRESFQAAKVDVVMFDEEPPEDVYSEGLTRTVATVPGEQNGLVICTFTPLSGISNVVQKYLPGGIMPSSKDEQLRHWGWA